MAINKAIYKRGSHGGAGSNRAVSTVGKYPAGYSKTDKANLRRKCRDNFKLEDGLLYYRKKTAKETESWRTCVQVDFEKKRIMERCHSGVEGKYI